VADRYRTISGSIFEAEIGGGYDLVLIPNFLHHFDLTTNVTLLQKIRRSMNPTGRVAIIDFVPNEDRVSPAIPAAFAFVMLANTERGDVYTFHELDAMLREAGFGSSTLHDLAPAPHRLVLTDVSYQDAAL